MSYRKKVLIQERNILLEKKYILEQTALLPNTPTSNVPPTSGVTTTPTTTTTTTIKKMSDSDLKLLPNCSTIDSKIKKQLGYTSNDLNVFVTNENKPLCTTKKGS